MKLKAFETLDKLFKLYEAAEDVDAADAVKDDSENTEDSKEDDKDSEEDTDDPEDTDEPDDQPQDATMPPDEQTEPEDDNTVKNIFVSAEKKVEYAKLILNALNINCDPATIPQDLLNVTVNNADDVINFVIAYATVEAPLSLTNQQNINSLPNALIHA